MTDYFRCAKNNGKVTKVTNIEAIFKVTEVTILFQWSKPHDIFVVKIAS